VIVESSSVSCESEFIEIELNFYQFCSRKKVSSKPRQEDRDVRVKAKSLKLEMKKEISLSSNDELSLLYPLCSQKNSF